MKFWLDMNGLFLLMLTYIEMKFWLDMNGLFLLMLIYRNEVLVRHEWTISTNAYI